MNYLLHQISIWWLNYIIAHCWFLSIRLFFLKLAGAKIGAKTIIDRGWYVNTASKLVLGDHCHINNNCMFDARGGIKIGDNVSISYNVVIESAGNDFQSPSFDYISSPITINDNAWIGLNVTILMGVEVGEGAVIASGAIVTKDCEPWGIYAGVPARKIGERKCHDVQYDCTRFAYWRGIRKPYLR